MVDTYSEMELCIPIWLNHDLGDGGVVDILAVDAYSGVEVLKDQRRRPDGGEWEPIKISYWNLAYIPTSI
jgi:hypothetical protein